MAERASSVTSAAKRVSWKERLGWGCGGWADNYTFNIVGLLYMYIYVDFFKMDPALAGLALAVPRFFDAVTDPIMGNWSDNFRSRWGRRRPLIVIGAILCGVLLPLHWMPPFLGTVGNPWYQNGPFLFFTLMGCIYAMAYTIFIVPFTALGFELSDDYEERTHVLCWRRYLGLCGQSLVPFVYKLSVKPELFPNIHVGAIVMSCVAGLFVIVLGIMPAICCKENPMHQKQQKISIFSSLGGIIHNGPYVQLILGLIVTTAVGSAVAGASGLITLHYICGGNEQLNGDITLFTWVAGAIVSVVSLFTMTKLATRVGKREGFIIGTIVTILGYLSLTWTYIPKYPFLHLVSLALVWISSQGSGLMLDSMCSDVCEYEEYLNGQRAEGMMSSFRTFTAKACNALCGVTAGLALKFCGYDPTKLAQGGLDVSVFLKLKALYIILPIVGSIGIIIIFCFYPLTKKRVQEIHEELEKRRAAAAAGVTTKLS